MSPPTVFSQRVITSLVLAPTMVAGIFLLPLNWFALFIGVIVMLGAWEWAGLAGLQKQWQRCLYSFVVALLLVVVYFAQQQWAELPSILLWLAAGWWLVAFWLIKSFPRHGDLWHPQRVQVFLGAVVLIPMWVGLYQLKSLPDSTVWIVILMLYIWGADIGAYFAGRAFGHSKLAPNVSPGKTWAGVVGGLLTVYLVATAAGLYLSDHEAYGLMQWFSLFLIGTLVLAVSIVGDLLESMMKRNRGVKDSSHLLPGHGGVMDRIDSMSAAVPVYALCLMLLPVS